jgi:hypothetical protein
MSKDLFETQCGGKPLVGCLRVFIQYIRSYPPYLETVFGLQNLMTRNALTGQD